MALIRTTLASELKVNDTTMSVTNTAGLMEGMGVKIDAEWLQITTAYKVGQATTLVPVLRGRNGSAGADHALGASVTIGTAADFADPPAQSPVAVNAPANRVREIKSVGVAGALPLPKPGTDLFVMLTGTAPLAMTLANPGKDQDGDILTVSNISPAAHTVTYAGGFGGVAASDVVTFPAAPASAAFTAIACNERWINFGGGSPPPA
jgi:hypothetical protein